MVLDDLRCGHRGLALRLHLLEVVLPAEVRAAFLQRRAPVFALEWPGLAEEAVLVLVVFREAEGVRVVLFLERASLEVLRVGVRVCSLGLTVAFVGLVLGVRLRVVVVVGLLGAPV